MYCFCPIFICSARRKFDWFAQYNVCYFCLNWIIFALCFFFVVVVVIKIKIKGIPHTWRRLTSTNKKDFQSYQIDKMKIKNMRNFQFSMCDEGKKKQISNKQPIVSEWKKKNYNNIARVPRKRSNITYNV